MNQMLLRTDSLSLEPYMPGRMSDAPSYAPPVKIGEVMVGETVAQDQRQRGQLNDGNMKAASLKVTLGRLSDG
jgi:NADPH-dependent curcumin reductase CurA